MHRGISFNSIVLVMFFLAACKPGGNTAQIPDLILPTERSQQPEVVLQVQPTESVVGLKSEVSIRQVLPLVQSAPPDELEEIVEVLPGLTLYLDPQLPESINNYLTLPDWLALDASPENSSLELKASTERPIGAWIYALVAPFPTISSEASTEDLQRAWNGKKGGPFSGSPLLMSSDTYHLWSSVWGPAELGAVEILPAKQLLEVAWDRRQAWAIVPFEAIEPRWKVLEVDNQSPIRTDFDPENYALSLPLSVTGEGVLPDLIFQEYGSASDIPLLRESNWDAKKMTTVAMTGVTALVRATAFAMEQRGVTYPAQDIGEILLSADILHISNEVPFARDCPYPNPVQEDLKFCSNAKYIELLEVIGTDVVELTGDHFADWGTAAMEYTLKLYDDHDWPVYGGGENLSVGKAPLKLEHNGNKIAFIGCNAKGAGYAQAGSQNPGAVPCDFDYMQQEIKKLREQGFIVIVTFQHFEYYTYSAQPNQIVDAQKLVNAGAVIVSGSQAHQPQGMAFDQGAFIHHGLGNLFFDQYEISLPTRQAFIDRHIFYNGNYINTELIPILFVDFARPRLMNEQEAADLLRSVFSASGW